jgi:hypothetical protein
MRIVAPVLQTILGSDYSAARDASFKFKYRVEPSSAKVE